MLAHGLGHCLNIKTTLAQHCVFAGDHRFVSVANPTLRLRLRATGSDVVWGVMELYINPCTKL